MAKKKQQKPKQQARHAFSVEVTREQYDIIKAKAEAAGMTMTAFVRQVCLNSEIEVRVKPVGGGVAE